MLIREPFFTYFLLNGGILEEIMLLHDCLSLFRKVICRLLQNEREMDLCHLDLILDLYFPDFLTNHNGTRVCLFIHMGIKYD